jgi:hypothetical protein
VCDLETSKEAAKSPLKGCGYKPTMGYDAEGRRFYEYLLIRRCFDDTFSDTHLK